MNMEILSDEDITTLHNFCISNSLIVATPKMAGINTKIICFIMGNPLDKDSYMVYYNPRIVSNDDEQSLEKEFIYKSGSPLFSVKIRRYKFIRTRFQLNDGKTYTEKYANMTSRYFQQGVELLNGINPQSRANKYHKLQAESSHRKTRKSLHRKILGK